MTIQIRPYREDDYPEIFSWWKAGEGPQPGMMVTDGTFVLEVDEKPVMSLTCFATQSPYVSFFEGFCAKSDLPKTLRHLYGKILFEYGAQWLKREKKAKAVFVQALHDGMVKRYEELGMLYACSGLTQLGREL